jgi:hypothetical protein
VQRRAASTTPVGSLAAVRTKRTAWGDIVTSTATDLPGGGAIEVKT